MKNSLLLILFLVVSGCKSFNDYQNQRSELLEGKSQKFTLDNNQFTVDLYVNGKKGNFLFDTGATVSVITNKDFINNFSLTKENYYNSAKVKGATGTTIESNHFISETINSDIVSGKNNIFRHLLIEGKKTNCVENPSNVDGIIGFDVFKRAGQPILLDFENQKITVLDPNYLTDSYAKLEAKIPTNLGSKIIIPFLIDGNKMEFLFDTGNSGGFFISNNVNKIDSKKLFAEIETLIGTAGKMSYEKIKFYKDVSVKYNDILDKQINVSSFPKLITNTVGISFIKQFNWILDFKTGAMFMKQISETKYEEQNDKLINSSLKSGVLENRLIIAFKNSSTVTKFNVGDEIIAIKNQKVTAANLCEMQELLNKTEDWTTLQLKTIPAKS